MVAADAERLTPRMVLAAVVPVVTLVLTGLFAGLFFAFTVSVVPGLRRSSDPAYVEVMQGINRAILNPVFGVVFAGAPLLAVVAAVLGPAEDRGWLWAAAALLAAVLVITFVVSVPLNDALDRAGSARDAARTREAFDARWVRWNTGRTVLSTVALTCLAVATAG